MPYEEIETLKARIAELERRLDDQEALDTDTPESDMNPDPDQE